MAELSATDAIEQMRSDLARLTTTVENIEKLLATQLNRSMTTVTVDGKLVSRLIAADANTTRRHRN